MDQILFETGFLIVRKLVFKLCFWRWLPEMVYQSKGLKVSSRLQVTSALLSSFRVRVAPLAFPTGFLNNYRLR